MLLYRFHPLGIVGNYVIHKLQSFWFGYFKVLILLLVMTTFIAATEWIRAELSIKAIENGFPAEVHFSLENLDIRNTLYFKAHRSAEPIELTLSDKQTFTSFYPLPGYYKAQVADHKSIKINKDVYVKSNGWVASLGSFDEPVYLDVKVDEDLRQVSLNTGSEFKVKPQAASSPITFHYFDALNPLSSLDFNYDFDFKAAIDKNSNSPLCTVIIEGINGTYSTPIYSIGQEYSKPLIVANKNYQAKQVKPLFAKNESWNHLNMTVKGGWVTYTINQKEKLKLPITASCGQIVGLRLQFPSSPTFKNVTLTDTKEVAFIPAF